MKNNQIICPHCKSQEVVKRGCFITETHGKQQRYYCKSCSKKFIEKTPFYRMRNNPQKITLCLDLFYKGVSTRQIQHHLQAFYPHNASWVSIYQWIVKYSKKISQFTDNLKLQVGKEMQIDEVEYKTKGKQSWFIDSIDTKTRFMVASNYVKSRGQNELKQVLKLARKKTDNQFETITSDGFLAYPKAVNLAFGYYNFQRNKIKHKVVTQLKREGFNIMIERMHNSLRQRTKTFRGFHGSIESANSIMKGFEIYYNFIRPHLALKGKTPSDLATDIKLEENNKWLELIKMSC
ncbi:DDE-type integrase/transposase/recombinase [Candidatus Pacearchaeota archaeon]|jgi:transposase-like protein|nr:DDE-type integrase/transposase/recombinase [Candidatus Pacearchaeota archaeon]